MAFLLSFHLNLELVGLWLGNGFGLLLIGLSELYVIYTADWNKIIEAARLRNGDGDAEENIGEDDTDAIEGARESY
ncbi:unnamed protein product [Ambrosiozyma monospora]|uniref:Unnamed protein product n=1 Tax=Ambrosiozyma monospora TaxID=43982 RepID=A0A9W6WI83_AMBMO|nr:unnamed protein product [Ambrosiozyma monospora]